MHAYYVTKTGLRAGGGSCGRIYVVDIYMYVYNVNRVFLGLIPAIGAADFPNGEKSECLFARSIFGDQMFALFRPFAFLRPCEFSQFRR